MAEALSVQVIREDVLPTVISLSNDPIPNIRFNVAKSLEALIPLLKNKEANGLYETTVKPALEKLCEDTDGDVKFFANRALEHGQ
jgi:serine/threonine-protein phosphatase 2A regulatory subunit A